MEEKDFIEKLVNDRAAGGWQLPDKKRAETAAEDLFGFLFSGYGCRHTPTVQGWQLLKEQYRRLFVSVLPNAADANHITRRFFESLPAIYEQLREDAQAILDADPAATCLSEVVVAYPGFFATAIYRLSHALWRLQVPVLPRLFTELAHSRTGIDIHPAAHIGRSFAIDHGTGIVIGETTIIGDRVKIFQGVTLGALQVEKGRAKSKRHPTIEDDVVIYSGATILGGTTVIGQGSIIGGNVWLTHSVPAQSVVYHKSEVKIRGRDPFPEPLNFMI